MDRARFLLVVSVATFMLGGCATLTVVPADRLGEQRLTPTAEPVAHIYAANWGVYLFKYLPLITGSLSRPGVPCSRICVHVIDLTGSAGRSSSG